MGTRCFIDGPWHKRRDDDYSAVPSVRIPVYADAPGVVCADEQVVKRLGHYERQPVQAPDGAWFYIWRKAQ